MGLIIPGSNDNLSKMAKEAGTPPPQMSPQQIPLDRIIVEISAQVANQMFVAMIEPVIDRIDAIEKKIGIDNDSFDETEDDSNV